MLGALRRQRAVDRGGDRCDLLVFPRLCEQCRIELLRRPGHLHHDRSRRAAEHRPDLRARPGRQDGVPPGDRVARLCEHEYARTPYDRDRSSEPERSTPTVPADGHDQGPRALLAERDRDRSSCGSPIRAGQAPGRVDGRHPLPGAPRQGSRVFADVAQVEVGDPQGSGVVEDRARRSTHGRRDAIRPYRLLQLPQRLSRKLCALSAIRPRRRRGVLGGRLVVVSHHHQAGSDRCQHHHQAQTKAGRPPQGTTGLAEAQISQGARRRRTAWSAAR